MKRPVYFLFLLTLAFLNTRCASETEMGHDPTAMTDTTAFVFAGDFQGPLGLQLWSVRQAMGEDPVGTLARVRGMGFREVELAGTYGMTPARFRQVLDSLGLDVTSMHVAYERFRDDLPEALVHDLEALCRAEPVATKLADPPRKAEAIRAVLDAHLPLTQEERGPAYRIPEEVQAPAEASVESRAKTVVAPEPVTTSTPRRRAADRSQRHHLDEDGVVLRPRR